MTISLQKSVLSAVGGLALLFNTGVALSASAASAFLDWSTFNITAIDLGSGIPDYSYSDKYTEVDVEVDALHNWQYDFENDWTSPISVSLGGSNAQADESQMLASTQTSYGYGLASVDRHATIEINGSGLLLFTADYDISAVIDGQSGDYAFAGVNFWADIFSQNGLETMTTSSFLELETFGFADQESKSKTLGLAFLVNDGDTILFSANSFANVTAVPVPAAVWLLGSALIGLISVGRRRVIGA
ncbi:MAG: VPLPA-CTERM sorting domain-containing protein [Gammaproteobacteria bacterium]|uniref:VPLPA-CTERM sorting domain-containing protein n=1 Tax=Methylotuvimicrobium sp. TaxID=2822413 RepID=UPI001D7FAF79|nr:VPLPA-CTERM sorting domain-containing protein [Gammaproteobacteria bacterium]